MASFGTFNTDFSGADRFKDIMENGGNVSVEQLRQFLKDSVGKLADNDSGEVEYKKFGNDIAVVVSWEPGFSPNDPDYFTDENGYAICASIREAGSSYMVEDWAVIGDQSIPLTVEDEKDDFADCANALYIGIMDIDEETVDEGGQDRAETVFDTLPDFKGTFENLLNSVNGDDKMFSDLELGNVDYMGYPMDAVIFVASDGVNLVDADMDDLEKLFNTAIEEDPTNADLKNWLEETERSFTLVLKDSGHVAFIVL